MLARRLGRSIQKCWRRAGLIAGKAEPSRFAGRAGLSSNASPPQKVVRDGPMSWRGLAVSMGIGTGLLGFYTIEKQRLKDEIQAPSRPGPPVGKASIGGPFNLIDCNSGGAQNKTVTEESFLGRYTLLYFGFTFCPDICPDELEKISKAVDLVEQSLPDGVGQTLLQPLFISVDPERDSPRVVAEYLTDFHPRFHGLTGTLDEIGRVAKAYRVYYSKDINAGPSDSGATSEDYLVDHSIITYLMGPEGEFIEFFGKTASAEDMALRIAGHLRNGAERAMKLRQAKIADEQ